MGDGPDGPRRNPVEGPASALVLFVSMTLKHGLPARGERDAGLDGPKRAWRREMTCGPSSGVLPPPPPPPPAPEPEPTPLSRPIWFGLCFWLAKAWRETGKGLKEEVGLLEGVIQWVHGARRGSGVGSDGGGLAV